LKHLVILQPDFENDPKLRSIRRSSEKMARGFLSQAGLDMKPFEALLRQRSAELERIVKKHKADALRRASRQRDALQSSIRAQSKALRSLAARGGFFPNPFFVLDTPFHISTPGSSASAEVPWGSWAKSNVKSSASHGTQYVSFYFIWTNPNPFGAYSGINAFTFLSATGYLKARSPWDWFSQNESSVKASAQVTCVINLLGEESKSLTSPSGFLGEATAISSTWSGDYDTQSISAGQHLNVTMVGIPAIKNIFFGVNLVVESWNDNGDIEADFKSGNFQITCPFVAFSLLNSPPISPPIVMG
jgi:hypothetical protein